MQCIAVTAIINSLSTAFMAAVQVWEIVNMKMRVTSHWKMVPMESNMQVRLLLQYGAAFAPNVSAPIAVGIIGEC